MCITLPAFSGNAFAVRYSRSAIFFICDFFGDDLASYQNSSISCSLCNGIVWVMGIGVDLWDEEDASPDGTVLSGVGYTRLEIPFNI